jgi:hypothetical protein
MSPSEILADPKFRGLPEPEQLKVMRRVDSRFASLPEDQQKLVISKSKQEPSTGPPKPPPGIMGGIAEDLSIGWRSGEADIAHTVANVAHPLLPGFSKSAEEFAVKVRPKPEETASRTSLPSQVLQGVGSAPATVLKYLPAETAGKYAPLVAGVIGAASKSDEGWEPALKEGVKDAITFGAMGEAGRLPTRTGRAVASATAAGATTAAFEGGDLKQTAAAAIMGGTFGAVGKHKAESGITPEQAKKAMEGGMGALSALRDNVRKVVAPQNRGPEARRMATIIRANVSDVYRQADVADYALKEASKSFQMMPDDQRLGVIHAIETGAPQDTVKWKGWFGGERSVEGIKMQEFVDSMRKIHNQVRDELIETASRRDPQTGDMKPTALKTVVDALNGPDEALRAYYENYFPHLFTNPEKAESLMQGYYAGKRPLPGPATFLHQRKHPTIQEALGIKDDNGKPALSLVTTDPVQAYMLKWREMKRFTAAQRIIKEMDESSMIESTPVGKKGPVGWVEVKDRAFHKSRRNEDGSLEVTHKLWVPEAAGRVLNNYLSPGLRQYSAYRGLMAMNNSLNQAQLGLSAFHLGFTSVDSVISRFALGMEQTIEGIRRSDPGMVGKGGVNLIKGSIGAPVAAIENIRMGRKMREEWRNPGSSGDPEIAKLVGMMQEAGAGVSLDPVYRTHMANKVAETFRQHSGYLKLVYRLPLAVNEKVAMLLMDKFVPWQKLGVFADLARHEMEKLPEGATRDQIRQVMGKAWDSVDNRMGMLRYDNLFWDKAVKDMAMATVRSVGWNLGTLRELGGGVMDMRKAIANKATGKHWEFTHRMAYTASLPIVTGLMGGFINYMYTGQRPEGIDYWFPRTGHKDEFGRDERISIPSYMKDLYHLMEGAKDIATGAGGVRAEGFATAKLHSSFGAIADMLHNKDFYNTEIANSEDPFMKRATDYTAFLVKQYHPLSWDKIARERRLGFPMSEQALTLAGFVPAPSDIKKTSAERLSTQIMSENLPQRASTREQKERQDQRRELERRIRTQDHWEPFAQQQMDTGALSEQDILYAVDRAAGLPLDRSVQRMRLEDAVKVWKLATPEEKRRLKPIFAQKAESAADRLGSLPEKQRKKLATQILEILNEQVPNPPPGE